MSPTVTPSVEPPRPKRLDTPDDERSLDRHYLLGLVCMAVLILAFPIYKTSEPRRRARTTDAMRQENVALGAKMFAQHCSACHGDQARGGRGKPTLASRQFLGSVSDQQLHWLISGGVPGTAMSPYDMDLGGPFTPQEIARLVAYLRSLEPNAPSVPGWFGGEPVRAHEREEEHTQRKEATGTRHDSATSHEER
jgi:mono/diheme cytochrome c family protein